ncbi:Serine/threonine-protein kinase TOR [Capsicum baccatum]|uniref:Serine/threonine-protein kinase TOR n=1 Tax=Capsicum baccatum TaxID=33114 RepID=A0A2G2VC14_CAPBA|nr:Serine/threonine-protein kinase TOR [Capsicum baccatum]
MFRNTGEFIMSRYREVAEIVLRYLEHRDRLVRLSITSLLPRIDHFLHDQFVTNYLMICMNHILHVLKIPAERASGFIALEEISGALDGELINYWLTISSHLRDAPILIYSLWWDGAALTLRRLVEKEARDLSGEAFAYFMDHLYEGITTFLDSNEVSENLRALRAIYELIDVTISENASKVAKFSNYMRAAFETKCDPKIFVLASKVLGHLAISGGAITTDEVERQVKFALEWLRGERIEYRRFAAVFILKEMAKNASTVFNIHVPEFVDAIWVGLRDPTLAVLGKAVEALRAFLRVIEKRETRYYRMFEATQYGLGRNASVHSIHGSLLAVGELLRYLEHRDRLVRLSITSLLPRIAHFLRDQFVTNCLMICMNHILHVLKIPAEHASGFIALGEMIAPRRGRPSLEALACVGNISEAMGPTMEPHVRGLLDSMFFSRLSLTLVEALEQITERFSLSFRRTFMN